MFRVTTRSQYRSKKPLPQPMHLPTEQTKPDYWVIVPTYNPGQESWLQWIAAGSKCRCRHPSKFLWSTRALKMARPASANQEGFQVFTVNPAIIQPWRHKAMGARASNCKHTRQLNQPPRLVVYLTQDALLDGPQAIDNLLKPLQDPQVAAAFGRQLAKPNAPWLGAPCQAIQLPSHSPELCKPKTKKSFGLEGLLLF